jgi:putative acetyltransferase
MIRLFRSDSQTKDLHTLVNQLDNELAERYGEAQTFFDQFNALDGIRNLVIAYDSELPVGCGAFKPYSQNEVEIKRMFVLKEYRGNGIAGAILHELESWAAELSFTHAVLETGVNQQEALRLYSREGYSRIANFGQYEGVDLSICMKKKI